jgi:hypothetical protein
MHLLLNNFYLAIVVAGVLLFCAAVAVLIVKLPEIRWRLANPPEMIEEGRIAREERIRNPDWGFYERYLQRPVPDGLKELFADRLAFEQPDYLFEVDGDEIYVTGLNPIDEAGFEETKKFLGLGIVPFADSDSDAFFLKPGPEESNAVYQADFHQTGYVAKVADDVEQFVKGMRASFKRGEP